MTFKLFGPYAAGVTPTCAVGANNPVFTTTGTLNDSGAATTSQTYLPPRPAPTYGWRLPSDALNDAAVGKCTDAQESSTIVGAVIDVTKSSDLGTVSAGDPIGFTIKAENKGSVPALGTQISDPLPKGADLNWSVSPAKAGCAITGAVGAQTLTCDVGELDGGSSFTVHIISQTTPADCGTVDNKAKVTTTNGTGGDSDTASIAIRCAAVT